MGEISLITKNWTSLWRKTRRMEAAEEISRSGAEIALLQETRLKSNNHLAIPKMKVIQSEAGVGTLIAHSDKLECTRVTLNLKIINYTAISINWGNKTILIVSIYVPCGHPPGVKEDLGELLTISQNNYYDGCILRGDWNAQHPSWNIAPGLSNGNALKAELRNNSGWSIEHSGENTFRGISNLDFFIVSGAVIC